jgi:membrane protein YqaA with SNARE-associated domain
VLPFDVFATLAQPPQPHKTNLTSVLRHLGASGLLLLAILDGSPIPTCGGPDILTMILAARHGEPWYYYAAVATLGSVIGAYLTFRIARGAGSVYLENKFGARRVAVILKYFRKWGTGVLFFSSLIPFPFPTSAFFAAAGVLNYPLRRFIFVVAVARAGRYFALADLASHFGRHFIRLVRHPGQYAGWWMLIACLVFAVVAAALFVQRRRRLAAS